MALRRISPVTQTAGRRAKRLKPPPSQAEALCEGTVGEKGVQRMKLTDSRSLHGTPKPEGLNIGAAQTTESLADCRLGASIQLRQTSRLDIGHGFGLIV